MKPTRRGCASACLAGAISVAALLGRAPSRAEPVLPEGAQRVTFADMSGFAEDDVAAALTAFRTSCAAIAAPVAVQAPSLPPSSALTSPAMRSALRAICGRALRLPSKLGKAAARDFFVRNFTPYRLDKPGFLTGYYEPVVEGSLRKTRDFAVPLFAPPSGMVARTPGTPALLPGAKGALEPMPDRAAIDRGALVGRATPLVYLREPVEAFFVQVQGSARIRLRDGGLRRIAFAARNGYPYTGIGKVLAERLHVTPDKMGMSDLKRWIRDNGQGASDSGTALMELNRSYIFFRFDPRLRSSDGPIGAAGVSLTAGRSIAVDTKVWPLGIPFFVDTNTPPGDGTATAAPLQRTVIAQDSGSAIVGATRADLFTGTGAVAASLAGSLRQSGPFYVFWPKQDRADGAALR